MIAELGQVTLLGALLISLALGILPLIGASTGVDGMFPGYDEEDGYGMIASAEQDGQRIIAQELLPF